MRQISTTRFGPQSSGWCLNFDIITDDNLSEEIVANDDDISGGSNINDGGKGFGWASRVSSVWEHDRASNAALWAFKLST